MGRLIFFLLGIILIVTLPAWADMPEPPDSAIQHEIERYSDKAKVYIWHDENEQIYITVEPLTEEFTYFDEFSFMIDMEACDLDLYDEYGTHVYGDLTTRQTFYTRWSSYQSECNNIDLSGNNILRYLVSGSPQYTTYPNDWFTGVPPAPQKCDCQDTDSDGVPDAWDECADTPAESVTDAKGCPVNKKAVVIPLNIN